MVEHVGVGATTGVAGAETAEVYEARA
jgi:hypothetical protein